jgi:hypothetical protein
MVTAVASAKEAFFLAKASTNGPRPWVEKVAITGELLDPEFLRFANAPVDMAADRDVLWVLEPQRLRRVDLRTLDQTAVDLPAEAHAVAAGYGSTAFVAEPRSHRVWVVVDGEIRTLAEGPPLQSPQALVVHEGRLMVGGTAGLQAIDLADGAVATVAGDVGPIRDIVIDHVGNYVVALEEKGLLRIDAQGETRRISEHTAEALAFDAISRTLYVFEGREGHPATLDYVALLGDDPMVWRARDARVMKPFVVEGIELSGAEYWPYRGDEEPEYPADVLWGFYPEQGVVFDGEAASASATEAAVACAEQSYAALKAWAQVVPDAFGEAVAQGRSNRFYLWVNDYSEASEASPHDVRPARVWYWERKPAVVGRVPGYWKWETTLTVAGRCLIPQPSHIDATLTELLATRM